MKFAIVDVETTGLNPERDRITEIGIILIHAEGTRSEHKYLINPEKKIPTAVTHLTGISDEMVRQMPLFEEVVEDINDRLAGCIIVGHNVQFDYSFLKMEMNRLGLSFTGKTICTRDLSEFLMPGLRSYSLKSLCRRLKITNDRPHRAIEDAKATAGLFMSLKDKAGEALITELISGKSNSTLIPSQLKNTVYRELPTKPGVYYFIGKKNKPVYIGKANNIRQRVISHFRGDGNSLKILAFASGISAIRYVETGSEWLASLLEDHEIRHFWPSRNRSQKRNRVRFSIENYIDQNGLKRISITRSFKPRSSGLLFHQYHLASDYLRSVVESYRLNGMLCSLPGINESIGSDDHNRSFGEWLKKEIEETQVEIYFLEGRNESENGFVWTENGFYMGMGFISVGQRTMISELSNQLIKRFSSVTTENIVASLKAISTPDLTFKKSDIVESSPLFYVTNGLS